MKSQQPNISFSKVSGFIVSVLGQALFVWAMASNKYFSAMVRIQTDRGHTVATSGPYRWVRHPAYLGGVAFELALPLLLASWMAFIVGALCAVFFILRTIFEDRTLQVELPGYRTYAERVQYRLLPGVW